ARGRLSGRCPVDDRRPRQGAATGAAAHGKAQNADPAATVRGPDPGRHRRQDRRPRDRTSDAQRRHGQVLRRRCDPKAKVAREAEGREETAEAGGQCRDSTGSVHGGAEPGLMERIHSLYLHVPFCTWVCKYCDFNAYAVLEGLIPPYVEALSREVELAGAELPIGPLDTVFIGGGTPSLLTSAQLHQVLDRVRGIGVAPGAEITLEANPSNVTSEHVDGWLQAGVNRLSVGVQSLQPDALRFLERLHSGTDAIAALRTARAGGFSNINADLLYGVPGVNLAGWLEALEAVLAAGVQHLSAYELTVESKTRLGQEVRTGLV